MIHEDKTRVRRIPNQPDKSGWFSDSVVGPEESSVRAASDVLWGRPRGLWFLPPTEFSSREACYLQEFRNKRFPLWLECVGEADFGSSVTAIRATPHWNSSVSRARMLVWSSSWNSEIRSGSLTFVEFFFPALRRPWLKFEKRIIYAKTVLW